MWILLKFLFTGDVHSHEWVKITEFDIYEEGTNESNSYPIGRKFVCQCKHCGKFKSFDI